MLTERASEQFLDRHGEPLVRMGSYKPNNN